MPTEIIFYFNAAAFGVGLAMDAFSVSMANGLREPRMKKRRVIVIAGTFAAFQTVMPLAGWICVRTLAEMFESFTALVPWIALILLLYIGGKMIFGAILGEKDADADAGSAGVGAGGLVVQGIATSIDALSVGFTISELGPAAAVTESLVIGAVTFLICAAGVLIGRKFGVKLGRYAPILGGAILVAIGIEIFVSALF